MIDIQTELEQVPKPALELIRRAVAAALESGGVKGDGLRADYGRGRNSIPQPHLRKKD